MMERRDKAIENQHSKLQKLQQQNVFVRFIDFSVYLRTLHR